MKTRPLSWRGQRAGVAAALLAALALAGCGSGSDDSSSGDGQTIKLAALSDLSGPASVIGLSGQNGQKVAVDLINADAAKYLGSADRKLEVKFDDATAAPTTAVTLTREYVKSDEYVGIAGPLFTAQAQAIGPVVSSAKIPLLVPYTPGSKELSKLGDYVFAQSQPDAESGKVGVAALVKAWPDARKVGILFSDDNPALAALKSDIESELKAAGKSVVTASVPFASTDTASAISSLESEDVDVVYNTLNTPAQIAAMVQATRNNFSPEWFGYTPMFNDAVLAKGGEQAEGALLTADYDPSISNPLVTAFQEAYRAKFDKDPDSWAALGFQSIMTYAAAAADIDGDVTGAKLRDALLKVEAPAVVNGGTFSFNADRLNGRPPAVLQISEGKFSTWKG